MRVAMNFDRISSKLQSPTVSFRPKETSRKFIYVILTEALANSLDVYRCARKTLFQISQVVQNLHISDLTTSAGPSLKFLLNNNWLRMAVIQKERL